MNKIIVAAIAVSCSLPIFAIVPILAMVLAIAKGFGSDVVVRVLRNNGITDFMVEVGGEVVCSGVNDKGNVWSIGINKPIEDSTMQHTAEIQRVVQLDGKSLATSGNYLQYYYKDGVKYAHTIDPRTAKPVNHTLLSSSIIADDCMTADALATSCMVLGVDSAMSLIESLPNVEGYFIYSGENGEYLEKQTNGFIGQNNRPFEQRRDR